MLTGGGALALVGCAARTGPLGRSDSAVGLTVLALATTAELSALAWAAVRRDVAEAAVAAVIGSAPFNATATLGGAALVAPLQTGLVTGPAAAVLPLLVVALAREAGSADGPG